MNQQDHDDEYALILNQRVKIGRRGGFSTTAMGQRRASSETEVNPSLEVYLDFNPKGYIWRAPGQMTKVDYFMFALYTADLQPGDLVYPISGISGLTFGRIMEITTIMDFDGNSHHVEALVERQG